MLYNISHIYCDILYLEDKTRQLIPVMYLVAEILGQTLYIGGYA